MEGSGNINTAGATTETDQKPIVDEQTESLLASILSEIFYSPLNLLLVVIIAILIYKIIRGRFDEPHTNQSPKEEKLPKMKKRDFTVKELKEYDGKQPDGRILMAVNGNVYDVTAGKRFYGPGGPYAVFAGRDASRGLATFNVTANDSEEYDDLSDLNSSEMSSVKEWEMQLKERYEFVGKLLRPGEKPTNYSDEDEDVPTSKSNEDEKIDEIGSKPATTTANVSTAQSSSASAANEDSEVRKRITTLED
ncbi:membrane-associated progesterone receptor component 1-like [Condylostylus longicornis]|uniref:membrane-associated progesterone receptor component 1-like n=1 Tax=Condylostylus longicornis TaxID=2530218 RepID=UPI00244DBC6B|nr:membrane-associated progesterone receptor component 1-like [Condylostylus longicornis]